ncbi:MAG TPA: prolyl oligopeptidase family serine peptidase [Acidobacteriota bacterium]|nr:prolyl oligopeptidase family serine peptidase [Acidobacteriota bacterium]
MKSLWSVMTLGLTLTWLFAGQESKTIPAPQDPYLWLEDITGPKALDWVKARNAESTKELAEARGFADLKADLLKILDSKERIPSISKRGPYFYNFWRDANNPRGLWRRSTLDEYRKTNPKWDILIDLDALGKAENENWVWEGSQILKAGGYRHALIFLSRGGADATVVREFDLATRAFVKGGFELPEAKTEMSWIDENHVYVGTDFGPGSMTTSGYPRIAKRWTRGTPLSSAEVVFEGKATDVSASAIYDDTKGFERHFLSRSPTFYSSELFLLTSDGKRKKVEVPEDAIASPNREWLLIELRSPWTVGGRTYAAGSLLVTRFDNFMNGDRKLTVLFEPTPTTSLAGSSWTLHHLILNVLDDVKNKLAVLTPANGEWDKKPLAGMPGFATISASGVDSEENDDYFMTVSGYLTPTTLSYGTIGKTPEKLKELPAFFDATGLEVSQHFVKSKDGARIPYFQVSRQGLKPDGMNPTLLYGYGGFEISETPNYSPGVGRAWLMRGGVFVVANIRGGGEYGPRWHQAALKEKRLRAYEDFAAVAEDLVARKLTSVKHLGAMGGSNGGLLMGNMITLYPQLFGAIVCQSPLLDMRRYSKLLAGASWMAEFGDPDKPEEWAFIQKFSPYYNVKPGAKYPPVLFTTSTRDDRVHPGHARKMMAKMKDLGYDVRYYENIEGGHSGAADNAQAAYMNALGYTFLWQKLK